MLLLSYRQFRMLVLGTLVISALAADPALARRGQSTGGSGQCAVIPNVISNDVPGYYTAVGSGFTPYQSLEVYVAGRMVFTYADSAGNFAASGYAPFLQDDGQYTVYIYGGSKWSVLASCLFQVT